MSTILVHFQINDRFLSRRFAIYVFVVSCKPLFRNHRENAHFSNRQLLQKGFFFSNFLFGLNLNDEPKNIENS